MFMIDSKAIGAGHPRVSDAAAKPAAKITVHFTAPKSEPNLKSAFVFEAQQGSARDKSLRAPDQSGTISPKL
jgi:hypothetical protein